VRYDSNGVPVDLPRDVLFSLSFLSLSLSLSLSLTHTHTHAHTHTHSLSLSLSHQFESLLKLYTIGADPNAVLCGRHLPDVIRQLGHHPGLAAGLEAMLPLLRLY